MNNVNKYTIIKYEINSNKYILLIKKKNVYIYIVCQHECSFIQIACKQSFAYLAHYICTKKKKKTI
jgi:hypothetical protein